MRTIAAAIILWSTTTAAETARERAAPPTVIRLGVPGNGGVVERASFVVRNRVGHAHVAMTVVLGAPKAADQREVQLPIDVSRDANVIGLALGDAVAFATTPRDARDTYIATVDRIKDPALLEWSSALQRGSHLVLRVFPVKQDAPATLTFEIDVPDHGKLKLDPAVPIDDFEVDTDGHAVHLGKIVAPQLVALDDAREETGLYERETEPVDRKTSLVAIPVEHERQFINAPRYRRDEADDVRPQPTPDAILMPWDVKDAVTAHAKALADCYELGRLLDPSVATRATLVLGIAPDGTVRSSRVEDADDDMATCIADEASTWNFRAPRHPKTLRYAFDLSQLR